MNTIDDVMGLLDRMVPMKVDWEPFYAEGKRKTPFLQNIPDENLVKYFETGKVKPGRVIDLGCGIGRNAIFMAKCGCLVEAIDLSETAIARARMLAQQERVDVTFSTGSVFELSPQPDRFGFVYDAGLLHHLQLFYAATDELLFMDADPSLSEQYAHQIVDIARDLNPVLIHLRQRDVEASLRRTCRSRGRMWTRHQVDWKVRTPYGVRRGYCGFDGLVRQFEDFCAVSDHIARSLPIEMFQIDVLDADWPNYYAQILDFLSGVFQRKLSLFYKLSSNKPFARSRIDGKLWLWCEPGAVNLRKFEAIECITEQLEVNYTPDLKSLDGLQNLEDVRDFRLGCNEQLMDLCALRQLKGIRGAFSYNDAVRDLNGLRNLECVGGPLKIVHNPALEDLTEFSALKAVGDVYIVENAGLSQQSVHDFVAALRTKGWDGKAVIAANGVDYNLSVQANWC